MKKKIKIEIEYQEAKKPKNLSVVKAFVKDKCGCIISSIDNPDLNSTTKFRLPREMEDGDYSLWVEFNDGTQERMVISRDTLSVSCIRPNRMRYCK